MAQKKSSASRFAFIHLERVLKALDEAISVEWFREVANRPGRKRPRADLLIGECSEKNKWNAVTLRAQMILQLNAAHAGHLDVCNDTREVVKPARLQECFCGRKCMYDGSERSHETVSRGTHGWIIINDRNKGGL
jgi:hypothetical protein